MIKSSLRILTTSNHITTMNKSTFTRDHSSYFKIVLPDSFTYKCYQTGRMVTLIPFQNFFQLLASCLNSPSLPPPPFLRLRDLICIHVFMANT